MAEEDIRTARTPYSTAERSLGAVDAADDEGELSAQALASEFENLAVAGVEAVRNLGAAASLDPAASTGGASVTELNNIDFKKMIGGPLQAAVDAQVASSLATVNFIQQVGFKSANGGPAELVMVDFTHSKKDVNEDGTPNEKTTAIKVPLLAMLPIPSLRIEHVIIDFNAKLNSVQTSTMNEKIGVDVGAEGGWGPVKFKVSASYQRQTATGTEVKKEYSLSVNVKAVQDEMPAGLEKILGMLAA